MEGGPISSARGEDEPPTERSPDRALGGPLRSLAAVLTVTPPQQPAPLPVSGQGPPQQPNPQPPQQPNPQPPQQPNPQLPQQPHQYPYPPQPYGPPASPVMDRRASTKAVLALVALVLLLVAMATNGWYHMEGSEEDDYWDEIWEYKWKVGLGEVDYVFVEPVSDYEQEKYTGTMEFSDEDVKEDDLSIVGVATTTKVLMFVGLIMLLLFLVLLAGSALGRVGPPLQRAVPVLGLVTGVVLLLGVIYFAVAMPGAVGKDADEHEGFEYLEELDRYPSYSWVLAAVAGVMVMVLFFMPGPSGPAPAGPPGQQYMQPYQRPTGAPPMQPPPPQPPQQPPPQQPPPQQPPPQQTIQQPPPSY